MNINLILLIGALLLGFFILSQCVGNSSTEVPEHEHSHGSRRQQYRVNRTRGDWNNLRQGGRSNRKLRELRKDSFGQNRYWDEIYLEPTSVTTRVDDSSEFTVLREDDF